MFLDFKTQFNFLYNMCFALVLVDLFVGKLIIRNNFRTIKMLLKKTTKTLVIITRVFRWKVRVVKMYINSYAVNVNIAIKEKNMAFNY